MKSQHYDIVRREGPKGSVWLEAASDLNTAESRIEELASFWPGTFQIMDQRNHQIVEETIGPSDRNQLLVGPRSLSGATSRIDMGKRRTIPTLQNAEPARPEANRNR
jgi:hypothetical protein